MLPLLRTSDYSFAICDITCNKRKEFGTETEKKHKKRRKTWKCTAA